MIIIKLTDQPGVLESMTPDELYGRGRGNWDLGAKADRERYALIGHHGKIHVAVEISHIEDTDEPRKAVDVPKRAIVGKVLPKGHPVYDAWVGSDMPEYRNPIHYLPSPFDRGLCKCGCGELVPSTGRFLPGHDQRAIHERIAKIGSVAEFLDWFDEHYPQ